MKKPFVLGFYGNSGSGKTSLIKKLIKELTNEGNRIAAVKITNKRISIDTKGKDTWKFVNSGAKLVVFRTGKETSYMLKTVENEREIINKIRSFCDFDVVLIEGSTDKDIPKIKIGKCKKRRNTVFEYENNFQKVISFIKQNMDGENMSSVIVKVNEKQIQLTEFPEKIIKNTICGMLKSLKGIDEIKKVEISFEVNR